MRSNWVSKALISDQKDRIFSSCVGKENSFPSQTSSMAELKRN